MFVVYLKKFRLSVENENLYLTCDCFRLQNNVETNKIIYFYFQYGGIRIQFSTRFWRKGRKGTD